MGVRLNKAMTELNIGLDTVTRFLNQMPELGSVGTLTPNSKITDEQFEALAKEYRGDAAIKRQAGGVFAKIKERRERERQREKAIKLSQKELRLSER